VFDIDHVMERRSDRPLEQLSMEELCALYFYHSQREEFLRRQQEILHEILAGGISEDR
jgi:hypothetical protein